MNFLVLLACLFLKISFCFPDCSNTAIHCVGNGEEFPTISSVMNIFKNPGDKIYIRAGQYNENVNIRESYGEGTMLNPIEMTPYPNERVVIEGTNRLIENDAKFWRIHNGEGELILRLIHSEHNYGYGILSYEVESFYLGPLTIVNHNASLYAIYLVHFVVDDTVDGIVIDGIDFQIEHGFTVDKYISFSNNEQTKNPSEGTNYGQNKRIWVKNCKFTLFLGEIIGIEVAIQDRITIENNYFDSTADAILASSYNNKLIVAYYVSNLIIQNNVFNMEQGMPQNGIEVRTYGSITDNTVNNVTIQNNLFVCPTESNKYHYYNSKPINIVRQLDSSLPFEEIYVQNNYFYGPCGTQYYGLVYEGFYDVANDTVCAENSCYFRYNYYDVNHAGTEIVQNSNYDYLIEGNENIVMQFNSTSNKPFPYFQPTNHVFGKKYYISPQFDYVNAVRNDNYMHVGAIIHQDALRLCEAGKFWSDSCQSCGNGEYMDVINSDNSCKKCPLGTYFSGTGAVSCDDCSFGRFSNITGMDECHKCPIGTYQDGEGMNNCKLCPVDQYNSLEEQKNCTNCPDGMGNSMNGSKTIDDCFVLNCHPGSYLVIGIGCQDCPQGSYKNLDNNQIFCFECSPGTFNSEVGSTTISDCVSCPIGYYQDENGQGSCKGCESGKFQNKTGAQSCFQCPFGTYSQVGASNCSNCPKGYYQDELGQGDCKSCGFGKFQNETGATSCYQCPIGTFGDKLNLTAESDCLECQIGYYQDELGQGECKKCELGSFQNQTSASTCFECSPGTFANTLGQYECLECDIGYFSNRSGSIVCNECEKGEHNSIKGMIKCKKCLSGKYSNVKGSVECVNCDQGKYSPSFGAIECIECETGKFQHETGKDFCNPCTLGFYQPTTGNYFCLPCSKGSFGNETGLESCYPCQTPHYYQDEIGKSDCKRCDEGFNCTADGIIKSSCFGIDDKSENVCSGHGKCEGFDYCKCDEGYYQKNCSGVLCYGIFDNSSSVCSGHGVCNNLDQCICENNYFDDQCSSWKCFEYWRNDTRACSYPNGTCSSYNKCQCQYVFSGIECDSPQFNCSGISSSDPNVCEGHGDCLMENICSCNGNYVEMKDDSSTCVEMDKLKCDFIYTDPKVCNGHGDCVFYPRGFRYNFNYGKKMSLHSGKCACDRGYLGDYCERSYINSCDGLDVLDPNVCSGNGKCLQSNRKSNESNQYDYAEMIPVGDTYYCHCNAGYIGLNCSDDIGFSCNYIDSDSSEVCNGMGECIGNYYELQLNNFDELRKLYTWNFLIHPDKYYQGSVCVCNETEEEINEYCISPPKHQCYGIDYDKPNVCSGHGECDLGYWKAKCICEKGYKGNNCENICICDGLLANDTNVCNGHGVCHRQYSYYWGNHDGCDCEEPFFTVYNTRGSDRDNYEYFYCSRITTCYDIMQNDSNVCSGHGECFGGYPYCQCEYPYYGEKCNELPIECDGVKINGDSELLKNDGRAICRNGVINKQKYYKIYERNYEGDVQCECVCDENTFYTSGSGKGCQKVNCFGYLWDDSKVCSGNGMCYNYGNVGRCSCNVGYGGILCNRFALCHGYFSNDEKVCSGNGLCTSDSICYCNEKYYGLTCREHYICGGISFNDLSVCNGRGECQFNGTCDCVLGYEGNLCENVQNGFVFSCDGYYKNETNVCSGHGECIAQNHCRCNEGYHGIICHKWKCSGISFNNVLACSSHGICYGHDRCRCFGYAGDNCEIEVDVRIGNQSDLLPGLTSDGAFAKISTFLFILFLCLNLFINM